MYAERPRSYDSDTDSEDLSDSNEVDHVFENVKAERLVKASNTANQGADSKKK